jgi:hypothetical protein
VAYPDISSETAERRWQKATTKVIVTIRIDRMAKLDLGSSPTMVVDA